MPSQCTARTLVVVIDTEEEFDWNGPFNRSSHSTSNIVFQPLAQSMMDTLRRDCCCYLMSVDYPAWPTRRPASDRPADYCRKRALRDRCASSPLGLPAARRTGQRISLFRRKSACPISSAFRKLQTLAGSHLRRRSPFARRFIKPDGTVWDHPRSDTMKGTRVHHRRQRRAPTPIFPIITGRTLRISRPRHSGQNRASSPCRFQSIFVGSLASAGPTPVFRG